MKNILLIGGNGYIGLNLIKDLLRRKKYNISLLTSRNVNSHFSGQLHIINGQISEYNKINSVVENKKIDTIIHLACSILPTSSFEDFLKEQNNIIIPTYKLIKLCSRKKIMFVFFSSGGAVYGNSKKIIEESTILKPISYYGHAKKMVEDFIRLQSYLNDLKFLILRPSNPFGGYNNYKKKHGLILAIINSIKNQEPINIFVNKNTVRDFIHIDELVDAVIKILESKYSNEVFNIGTGTGSSISEICNFFKNIFPDQFYIKYSNKILKDVSSSILCVKKIDHNFPNRKKVSIKKGLNYIAETLKKEI